MTFEQIDFFITLAEHDTFLDAAEALHLSQSNLSKQIMKLEKELDIILLDRSKRKASLTEAGRIFYREALQIRSQYQESLKVLEPYRCIDDRNLRIGTLPILAQYRLSQRLHALLQKYPSLSLSIYEAEETELMERFEANGFDAVITREHLLPSGKYQTYPLAYDRLVVVMPTGHPLTAFSGITPEMLQNIPLILMNPYTSVYQLCMEAFKKASVLPLIKRTARVESILSSVSLNEGISLLPQKNLDLFHFDNIEVRPLKPDIPLSVVLALKKQAKLPAYLKDLIKNNAECI